MRITVLATVLLTLFSAPAAAAPDLPTGSARAGGPTGVRGWAILLERAGHRVTASRIAPADRRPRPGEVLIMVAGRPLDERDRTAVLAGVSAGADIVAAGSAATTLGLAGLRTATVVPGVLQATDPRFAVLGNVRAGGTAFAAPPPAGCTPLMTTGSGAPAVLRCARGRGTITLVADASPLRNSALGDGDNAALAILLAGPPARRTVFLETIHDRASGDAPPTGLSLLPPWVKRALVVLALALLAWLLAHGRRLGPPEELARPLPPPRRAHVDALAARLARAPDREAAAQAIITEARAQLGRRFGLGPAPGDDAVVAAAHAAGLDQAAIAALGDPAGGGLLAAADTLAAINDQQRPGRPL